MTRLSDDAVSRLREAAAWPELPPERYELRALIGRGGMGAVYTAFDRQLDREVALKVSNGATPASGLDERLRREASVLARLEHPGIVPVHDAGELADGRWFYVMKLVRGRTLADYAPTLSEEAALLGVFERIAQTVAFAHDAGVVHRDLKPSNVMVGRFGEVLVLDWGVAKVLGSAPVLSSHDPSSGQGTAAGTRIGTPGFMAPEQERGDTAEATPASDVYSLGALLSWLLMSVNLQPRRRLRAIVGKCLQSAPEDRYPDAAALVADLGRYRAGLPVEAHPESALERAWRWAEKYRTFILLILAYLIMRAAFAYFSRR
jgi:serine/threonine protein kinase